MTERGFSQALTIESVNLFPLRASGGVSPSMALGKMPTRPALLISVTDTHGCTGWGEVWANFPPRANLHKAQLIDDIVTPKLDGFIFTDPHEADTYLRDVLGIYFLHIGQDRVFEHILAGLDTALWDLALRSAGRSFSDHMGMAGTAPSYASSVNPADLESKFREHAAYGQSAFKLKLGFGEENDIAFVEEAFAKRPQGTRLMVDSNQKWTAGQATKILSRLEAFDLLFAEESIPANAPLATWEAHATASPIPLAAGENVYGQSDFLAMANAGVRYLQPDVAKWGGVSGALDLAAVLPACVEVWPHFMGTAVGQVAALSVAAAVGPGSVCEMDVNSNVLRSDLCGDVLAVESGQTHLPQTPGLVNPPMHDSLKDFTEPY